MTIETYSDLNALASGVANRIADVARRAIAARGRCTIALAGGSTPRPIYQQLAAANDIDWQWVTLFWGDERCVPPDHQDSNFHMAQETLLAQVAIPAAQIFRMRGEGEPQAAASAYTRDLMQVFGGDPQSGPPPEGFDLILLGMGSDGHTASLFPGTPAVDEQQAWVVAQHVPHVDAWRITLTYPVINAAHNVVFAVAGADKAARVQEILASTGQPGALPAARVQPAGDLIWALDQAAAAHASVRAPPATHVRARMQRPKATESAHAAPEKLGHLKQRATNSRPPSTP
ncbi:6-phosphogluconolactonase [Candidatus Gracilibacteria bacterium]|nr:6-phosphogluconolactonase [Candidatus Gracilibacteria bacterium]